MSTAAKDPRIVIIGAGVAGITAAYTFTRAGFRNLTILEKGSDVGGVWYWNRYPGLTCDVPSQIYQFGFAPKPDWSHMWASGAEIQQYHRDVLERFGLDEYLRLNAEVVAAEYESAGTGHQWRVRLADGEEFEADFVFCATGVLHHPSIPDIPGLESFSGDMVHTARWDDSIVTNDKRIAVLGTGSTGIQVVSALQREASHISHFVRSPQWILWAPMTLPQPRLVAELLRRAPRAHDAIYQGLLSFSGVLADVVLTPTWRRRAVQQYARISLRAQVRDPELRRQLTPDYQPLCKRQVVSGRYYQAIQRSNASLVTDDITEVTPTGITTADGRHHEVDLIVLATGFKAHNYMRPMNIVGRDGITLDDAWVKGPKAYRMTAIPGFPNLFTILGPNSPTGSISLQYSAEQTAKYLLHWLNAFARGDVASAEITDEATDRFNADVVDAMEPTVWNTGCNSWYLNEEDHTVDLWPYDRATLTSMLSKPEDDDYRIVRF